MGNGRERAGVNKLTHCKQRIVRQTNSAKLPHCELRRTKSEAADVGKLTHAKQSIGNRLLILIEPM